MALRDSGLWGCKVGSNQSGRMHRVILCKCYRIIQQQKLSYQTTVGLGERHCDLYDMRFQCWPPPCKRRNHIFPSKFIETLNKIFWKSELVNWDVCFSCIYSRKAAVSSVVHPLLMFPSAAISPGAEFESCDFWVSSILLLYFIFPDYLFLNFQHFYTSFVQPQNEHRSSWLETHRL